MNVDAPYIDRGYINAPIVDDTLARRGAVICRPWLAHNGTHFSKRAVSLNMRDRTITGPAGERQGRHARFIGRRKNEFDLRRAAAVSGLEVIQRRLEAPPRQHVDG